MFIFKQCNNSYLHNESKISISIAFFDINICVYARGRRPSALFVNRDECDEDGYLCSSFVGNFIFHCAMNNANRFDFHNFR